MKISIKLSVVLMSLAVFSCKQLGDDLLTVDSPSASSEAVIFSNPDLAKGAVDGIKIPMAETNSYRGRWIPFYGMNTDSEWLNSSESTSNDNADLVVYDPKPNNSQMNTANNVWAQMYNGIERANLCIRGLRTYGNPTPGSELGYLLGEALTLRAVYYSDLVKGWGDVPARFEPINTETVYLPKSSRDVIYKQILADLEEAETLVPWPNGNAATSSVERINKAFVKGLRARVALAASGYSQYPDGIRRSNDPELAPSKLYPLALQLCRDVINSGTARLETSFEGLWRKYNQEVLAAGNESLWEIPFAPGRGRVLFTFAINHTNNNQYQQMGNNRGGQGGPLPNVFYDFDQADQRRNITCIPYKWGSAVAGKAKQEVGAFNRWYFGKYRFEWMSRIVTSTNDDGVNKIYMRYAEILLMAAEAANEVEGPAAAAPYLKQIRNRAFAAADRPEKVENYVNALTSKTAMFNAIVEEQKFEFTGEMERKLALIRWNLLGAKMADAKERMTELKNRTGRYANVPSTLYYKYAADNETLIIYGLNRGEFDNPGAGWTSVDWTSLSDSKIAALYRNNPDTKQFWPIWQVFLDSSNGTLSNDYGY
ncbi:RagB/SusD family nutrient uptake outer membrane protein [Chryseobacterium sp. VAUSW3]|uniref:RagB/SusD family nutrient uptake outer membrane protein n=1 Tax=Chryseobacterium sp. VAUSW3 TaxID=2010998 RepID=UPI000B4CF09D|nr:RagB/SusD family nutrient uptake outer membrane protein [Chryseobacterium sp. VAUSW3]OWR15103.1 RagB/SusD family nutrient uptake outer membrane protein [Chryseobacterium sp. VAUSW3]